MLGADSPLTAWSGGAVQVRVLGPFQLEDGGQRVTIGGIRQRAVLARLLLHANEVVPSEQLLVDLECR
jgi:DNA-binding SARP family transcriptional activator